MTPNPMSESNATMTEAVDSHVQHAGAAGGDHFKMSPSGDSTTVAADDVKLNVDSLTNHFGAASLMSDRQVIKEYTLGQLGLLCTKTETVKSRSCGHSHCCVHHVKREDVCKVEDENAANIGRDVIKCDVDSDDKRRESQEYCTTEKNAWEDSSPDYASGQEHEFEEDTSDINDGGRSEVDEEIPAVEEYSFTNVYKEMRAIHGNEKEATGDEDVRGNHVGNHCVQEKLQAMDSGSVMTESRHGRLRSRRDGTNGTCQDGRRSKQMNGDHIIDNPSEMNGPESDGSDDELVDDTDEDVDWNPYLEDVESEDSDVTKPAKRRRNANFHGGRTLKQERNATLYDLDEENDSSDVIAVQKPLNDCDSSRHRGNETPKYTPSEFEGTVYYCTPCNRRYHTKTGFSQHKRFECGKPPAFKCLLCGKEFNRKSSLKRHLRVIHETGLAVNVNCVVHYHLLATSLEPANRVHDREEYDHESRSSESTISGDDNVIRDRRAQQGAFEYHAGVRRQLFAGQS